MSGTEAVISIIVWGVTTAIVVFCVLGGGR